MSTLVCNNISKKYGEKEVLKNVDLTLEKGKIYGLIGRNGAGKTTLLSIMSAQNPATSGEVTWEGEKVWENRRALNHICFSRELVPSASGNGVGTMKVKEYLQAASYYYPNWQKELAKELVEKFELDVKKKIAKLSKGMLSMVTIIVALASKAEFTFLDEPVAGLDVVMREYFYRKLLEEYMDTGRTFVVSTHIIEEAANVFEEVIFLKNKGILLKENTEHLVARCIKVSGPAGAVDAATAGMELHQVETMGRSKGVTVLLKEGEQIAQSRELQLQSVNLQNVFVALCGLEE